MAPRSPRPPHDIGRDWATVGLMLAGTGIALSGMRSVLEGFEWWIVAMVVATVMLAAAAIVRSLARHRIWGLLAGALGGIAVFTLIFAPGVSLLGVIPTPETLEAFGDLQAAGADSIAGQGVPAEPDQGILYLLCLGVAALVFAMDLFASGARMPVLTGLSLLVLLLVPSIIDPGLADPVTFALTAASYLGILLVGGRPGMLRPALAVGASALVAALVLPFALPSVHVAALDGPGGGNTVLNPIITLGNDLRRGDPSIAYTYTSTADGGDYFRMTALDDFNGGSWAPTVRPEDGLPLDQLGSVPGLLPGVPTSGVTSTVEMGDVRTRWLPVPYAPQSIEGLEGDWRFDDVGLMVGTPGDDARGQVYTVDSVVISPSVEQLQAAGTTVPDGFDRYLEVPRSLPDSVAETAQEVAGDAATAYEAATELQAYFRGGEFTYSEQAPVEQGYDGSGASVLGQFLEAKAGYCVHFSSAMAAMARTLGIPARVAVGFTAGTPVLQEGQVVYRVTTHEFHAWPELYFETIGWVRFEPTPGRGNVPSFALANQDDPTTPDVDESVPPPPPTPAATPQADPQSPEGIDEELGPQRDRAGAEPAPPQGPPVAWIVLWSLVALAFAPAVVRIARRELRMRQVRDGSGAAAWAELRDTVHDLGRPTTTSLTPRQFADELVDRGADAAAVHRLATALEHQAYGPQPRAPEVSDVRRVRRSLVRRASLPARLGAVLVPRSLFAAWLPDPALSPAD